MPGESEILVSVVAHALITKREPQVLGKNLMEPFEGRSMKLACLSNTYKCW